MDLIGQRISDLWLNAKSKISKEAAKRHWFCKTQLPSNIYSNESLGTLFARLFDLPANLVQSQIAQATSNENGKLENIGTN
jgi:hypothetical protein